MNLGDVTVTDEFRAVTTVASRSGWCSTYDGAQEAGLKIAREHLARNIPGLTQVGIVIEKRMIVERVS